MIRVAIVFVLGIGVGVLVTMTMGPPPDASPGDSTPATTAESTPFVAADDELRNPPDEALVQRAAELEARVRALEGERQALPGSLQTTSGADSESRRGTAASARRDWTVGELVAAGFTQERAQWLERRHEELVEAAFSSLDRDPDHGLRREIGDAEYEQYRTATGRDVGVRVLDITASSPAARAGLQSGDLIVSYDGERVFDVREITLRSQMGLPGAPVVVEILRQGVRIPIVISREPRRIDGATLSHASYQSGLK